MSLLNTIIGNNISEIRISKGYSHVSLAKMLGVSRQSISNWESGRVAITIQMLYQICKTLECSIGDILPTVEFYQSNKESKFIKKTTVEFISKK